MESTRHCRAIWPCGAPLKLAALDDPDLEPLWKEIGNT